MSWLYSQALVEEYLGDICLDGEQSVQSNGNNTQQAYCALDKMTKFSRLSRFGMMFKPLTENLGEELLMLYLEDFHAKTLVPQEKVQELKVKEVQCGNTWQELLAKYDPNLSLWKIPQCLLDEDLVQSLEIWPRWGSMRNGECFQQPMLALTIKEIGFGYWPTPVCSPSVTSQTVQATLDLMNSRKREQGTLMEAVVKQMWPTPLSTEHKANRQTRENHQNGLTQAVLKTENGGQLNPPWVEWLMGWPLGWTDLKPLETDKCHFVQQQPGDY